MTSLTIVSTVGHVHLPDGSFLTWRVGTGGNVEITNLRAVNPGHGTGTRLIRELLTALLTNPPYHTVYGFTRTANVDAQAFYRTVGFALSPVEGVYADGTAVVFSGNYDELCDRHGVTRGPK